MPKPLNFPWSLQRETKNKRPKVTVICPVQNEEKTIPIFYERFKKVTDPLRRNYDIELIFTNNRSTDRSLDVILEIREKDESVQVITLSRNFGYQASLQAGLAAASGDAIMFNDVDCEDPPEMLVQFLEKWEEGFDVVYGERTGRPEWIVIKKLRDYFYHVMRSMGDSDIVLYMAEFSMFSKTVREAIVKNNNTMPYLRAEIAYSGFTRFGIPYNREKRVGGQTHYNIGHLFADAIGAILTSSTFLLRFAAIFLLPFVLFNIFLFGLHIFGVPGPWLASLLVIDLIYIVSQLTICGLYIARIHKNVMNRPVFLIDYRATFLNPETLRTLTQAGEAK